MGLDIYLNWEGITDEEHDAQITGYQVAGSVGYLRSSYNESGFNRWAANYLDGRDLYWIFNKPHKGEADFTPDWQASLERAWSALGMAEQVRGKPKVMRFLPPIDTLDTPAKALEVFERKAAEDRPSDFDWLSSREGDFFLKDPPKVMAVMCCKGSLGRADIVLICEPTPDEHEWYISYIKDHVIPFIELGMSKPGAFVHWSA